MLCKSNDCTLQLIDVGLDADITGYSCNGDGPIVLVDCSNKIKKGSEDMLKGPAMSKQDCRIAQEIGRNAVENYIKSQNMGLDPSSLALCIGEVSRHLFLFGAVAIRIRSQGNFVLIFFCFLFSWVLEIQRLQRLLFLR